MTSYLVARLGLSGLGAPVPALLKWGSLAQARQEVAKKRHSGGKMSEKARFRRCKILAKSRT